MNDRFYSFAVLFSATYAVAYVISVENNYALVTYHPAIEEWGWLVEPPRDGPAMYWYGWMATAGIVAVLLAGIAWFLPQRFGRALWSGWAWSVPLVVIVFFGYLLRSFFTG